MAAVWGTVISGAGTAFINGGSGGTNPFGGAAQNGGPSQNGTLPSPNTGAGGAGGSTGPAANSYTGSGGGAGAWIDGYIDNPDNSYNFTIGAGGTLGTGGASRGNGSAGAAGLILVKEYYNSNSGLATVGPQTTALAPTVTVYKSGSW